MDLGEGLGEDLGGRTSGAGLTRLVVQATDGAVHHILFCPFSVSSVIILVCMQEEHDDKQDKQALLAKIAKLEDELVSDHGACMKTQCSPQSFAPYAECSIHAVI